MPRPTTAPRRRPPWCTLLSGVLVALAGAAEIEQPECSESHCRSPDGEGGFDCIYCARVGERASCAEGFLPKEGKALTHPSLGVCYEFTCCAPLEVEDKTAETAGKIVAVVLMLVACTTAAIYCTSAAADGGAPTSTGQQIWVENIARFTEAEMRAAHNGVMNTLARNETLVFHYTSRQSATLILAPEGNGLRASSAGQMGGGLSVCMKPPHEMGWEQWAGGRFREVLHKH